MGPRRLIATLSLAALLAAVGAGCGGGDESESTTAAAPVTTVPPALSKEELISQGDAICAEVNAAVGTVSSSSADSTSQVSQEAGLYGGMVERLKDLGTPTESEGYDEFIAAADGLAQAESDAELASERGDEAGLVEAQESAASSLSSFQAAAASYGFEECAEGPSAPVATSSDPSSSEPAPEEGGVAVEEEAAPSEPEPAPETGGAGGTVEAAPPSGGGSGTEGGGTSGGSSGGIGPG
jgi:hypothetical protein